MFFSHLQGMFEVYKLIAWAQSVGSDTVSDVVKEVVKLAIRLAGIPLP
jgi:hypothetical protein